MKDLVIFALPAKLPKQIISEINFPNKLIAPRGNKLLPNFATQLYEYKFIIGIGDYDGLDQTKIRLEQECHDGNQTFKINNFLTPSENTIFSKDIGNFNCNYISFLIMEKIEKERLDIKYSFIHVPKKMNFKEASEDINYMIGNLLRL